MNKTEQRFTTTDAEITNQCTCTKYDPITEEFTEEPADECFGDCWDSAVEDWHYVVREFVVDGGEFRIEGFPLWNRTVSGTFEAENTRGFLEAVTVRGEWRLRYSVGPDSFAAVIWHHDVPTGGSFTVSRIPDECECEIAFTGHCEACRADAI